MYTDEEKGRYVYDAEDDEYIDTHVDACYWRPIWIPDEDKIVVCCLQWFDEKDYIEDNYVTDERFKSEKKAWRWLAQNHPEYIELKSMTWKLKQEIAALKEKR